MIKNDIPSQRYSDGMFVEVQAMGSVGISSSCSAEIGMWPLKKNRILLVDDDAPLRQATRLRLEQEGYECVEAEDGVDALTQVDRGLGVDVIISDYHMPAMDGLQLLRALSYRVNGQGIQVILVSGNMTFEMERKALEMGACAVLEKPLEYPKLFETLSRVLKDPFSP